MSLSWLLLTLQVILSVVLLVAATEKMLRSEEFFAALRLSHLPAGAIAPIGVAVPAFELTLALSLLPIARARDFFADIALPAPLAPVPPDEVRDAVDPAADPYSSHSTSR